MTVLGIDTSTSLVSMGIVQDGRFLGEIRQAESRNLLENFHCWLDHLLTLAKVNLQDLTAISCITGPGSFTGLRIGTAAVQGLGLALGIPTIGINALECHAYFVGKEEIAILQNSRKNLYFYAKYQHHQQLSPIEIKSIEEIHEELSPSIPIIVSEVNALAMCLPERNIIPVSVSGCRVAWLGESRMSQPDFSTMELCPEYHRESYAELKK